MNLLLADGHVVLRQGLRFLLERQPDLSVVAEAGDGYEAIEQTVRAEPDVVVMDIAMPQLNGIEAIRQLLARRPQTKVVARTKTAPRPVIL